MDTLSLSLFESLLEQCADLPMLWVLLTQPFYGQQSAQMLTRQSQRLGDGFVYLGLEPLSDDETRIMLRGMLATSAMPPAFEETFLERTGGNPLMIQQSLRYLIEKRTLWKDARGEWMITAAAMREQQPDLLHAVIETRVGMLPVEARDLLQYAALAGDALLPTVLDGATSPNRGDLVKLLRSLDFFDDALRFSSPAVAAVIANCAPSESVVDAHRLIAAQLEKRLELDGPYLVLKGYHAGKSGQLTRAIKLYDQAKALAYARNALSEIQEYIERTRELIATDEQPALHAQLLVEQQEIMAQLGADPERCIALLQQAFDLYIQIEQTAQAADTMIRVAAYHTTQNSANECYREAQALLEKENPEHPMLPVVYLKRALFAITCDNQPEAKALFDRAHALALENQNFALLAQIHFEMGLMLRDRRRMKEALKAFQQALSYAGKAESRDHEQVILTLNYLADLHNHLGRPAEGEYFAFEATSNAAQGPDYMRVLPFITLSESYAAQARWQDALDAIRAAPDELATPAMPIAFWKGRWQFELGDRLDGLERMRDALPDDNLEIILTFIDYLFEDGRFSEEAETRLLHLIKQQDRLEIQGMSFPTSGYLFRVRGRMATADRDFGRALTLLHSATAEFEKEGFAALSISTRRLAVLAFLARNAPGDKEQARTVLAECLTRCRSLSIAAETGRLQQLLRRL